MITQWFQMCYKMQEMVIMELNMLYNPLQLTQYPRGGTIDMHKFYASGWVRSFGVVLYSLICDI